MYTFCRTITVALLFNLIYALPSFASWDEASQQVDKTTGQMLSLLNTESDKSLDEVMVSMHKALEPIVDFSYVAKVVMGKHYRKASPAQREKFANLFESTMVKTYAKALTGFNITRYEIQPSKHKSPSKTKQIVKVKVEADNGQKYLLVYYMRKTNDNWFLVNMVLDGVNLRLTFKNQFSDFVSQNKGDINKAMQQWQKQIKVPKGS